MTLPLAQSRVLRFVADAGPATVGQVARGLRMNRDIARRALTRLDDLGLAAADTSGWPASYTVTDAGKEALAAGAGTR